MDLDHRPIVIRGSRWKLALLALCFVVLATPTFLVFREPRAALSPAPFVFALFSAFALLFGVQAVRPATLTLGPSGFTVRTIWRSWSVRWDQASNFRLGAGRSTRYVSYDYKPDQVGGSIAHGGGRLPPFWTMNPAKLRALMIECKARWDSGASPTREPTVTRPLRPEPPEREPTVT